MRMSKILLSLVLIAAQANAAVVSNFIGREIPNQVVVSATAASYTVGSVTFTDAGDIVTLNGHKLTSGSVVAFGTITSTTGISINTNYYVINPTTNTFQLSLTPGGSAIALTTNGSGILNTSFYAIVHATVRNGGTFSVNGTVFLTSQTWSTINSGVSPRAVTASGSGFSSMAVTMSQGSASVGVPQASSTMTTATSLSDSGAMFANSTATTTIDHTFKVPAGTVLVGSGSASYVIELINI